MPFFFTTGTILVSHTSVVVDFDKVHFAICMAILSFLNRACW